MVVRPHLVNSSCALLKARSDAAKKHRRNRGLSFSCTFLLAFSGRALAHDLGANKFELLMQFGGRSNGGDGSQSYRRITRALGEKAILDAKATGISFFRVAASGFGPSWPGDLRHNDLALWQKKPDSYWRDVDAMMDALDHAGIQIVPSLLWNIKQFPALTGETVTDMIVRPLSRSRVAAETYIKQFIMRYKSRRTILFWEMGNEFNLLADVDAKTNCAKQFANPHFCASSGDFTTNDLDSFSKTLVEYIKKLDATRDVSSGYSTPRPAAYHLSKRPQNGSEPGDWRLDTLDQFRAFVQEINAPFDIVSLHIYPGKDGIRPELGVQREAQMAELVAGIVHLFGKKLYVGEFGDRNSGDLSTEVVEDLQKRKIDYASVWAWELYRGKLDPSFDQLDNDYRIEPGRGGVLFKKTAGAHGNKPAADDASIVLTLPLPCTSVFSPTEVAAVASVGAQLPDHVSFFLDGTKIGDANAIPYEMRLDPTGQPPRTARIEAVEYQFGKAIGSFASTIMLNEKDSHCDVNP